MSESLEVDFVLETVQLLVKHHGISLSKETVIHSDQGTHYTSLKFIQLVENSALRRSMSRRGNCLSLIHISKLTPEVLYAILTEEKPNQKEQIRIKTESLRKYFPRNYSAQQMEREIIKLLEARYRAKDRGER